MTLPDLLNLWACCAAGATAAVLLLRAQRRIAKLEADAQAYGVVLPVELLNPHRLADPEKELVRARFRNGNVVALGFTDATWLGARMHGERIEKAIKDGSAVIHSQ